MKVDTALLVDYAVKCGIKIESDYNGDDYVVEGDLDKFKRLAEKLPLCCEESGEPGFFFKLLGQTNYLYDTGKLTFSMINDYLGSSNFKPHPYYRVYVGSVEQLYLWAKFILRAIKK